MPTRKPPTRETHLSRIYTCMSSISQTFGTDPWFHPAGESANLVGHRHLSFFFVLLKSLFKLISNHIIKYLFDIIYNHQAKRSLEFFSLSPAWYAFFFIRIGKNAFCYSLSSKFSLLKKSDNICMNHFRNSIY